MKYIISGLIGALVIYLGYREDITFFQVLSWIMVCISVLIIILGQIELQILKKPQLQELKNNLPKWWSYILGYLIMGFNFWSLYSSNLFWVYVFTSLVATYFTLSVHEKVKNL